MTALQNIPALVPVSLGTIGGLTVHVVNARDLHTFLENGDKFAGWISARIEKYEFVENQDFAFASVNPEAKSGSGGHNRKDYLICLDMAKELSMVENNEKGREARRYFIAMERKALEAAGQIVPDDRHHARMDDLQDEFTLTPSPVAKPPQINQQARILADTLGSMVKIAKLCGLKGNQAVLSADRGTQEWAGVSPLKLLGLTHLTADPRGQIYTPTDLGEMLVPPIKGAAMNRLLETHGLQTRDTHGEWIPTAAAEGLYEWSDTHKRHGNGTPIKQLRWFVAVLDRLGVEYRINGGAQ